MSADDMLLGDEPDPVATWLDGFAEWVRRKPEPVPLVLPAWIVETLTARGEDVDALARRNGFDGYTVLPPFAPRRRRRR